MVLSGSPDIPNSYVSPCGNSCVSQSGWWCPAGALAVSNSLVCTHSKQFVSQSGWSRIGLWLSVFTCRPIVSHLSLRCLPNWFPRCGFPDVVTQLPQGFLGCYLVGFHLSWKGGFSIIFQLPSTIPICFPELVCPLSPSVFMSRPIVSQSSFKIFQLSRFCSRCAIPILS